MEVDLRTEPLVKQLADLRRRYGTGQGRGHPPSYAPAQAARVRDLRAQGMSIREIERAVNLSHGTVQRIIAKTATAPVPGPTREERHAARMRRADDKRLRSWPERMDAANAAVEEAEQTALRSRRRER
jgi:transposase